MQSKELFCKILLENSKKLVLILATFTLITKASKKGNINLKRVSCIYYPIQFKKDKIKALINSDNEVNIIIPTYKAKLGFKVRRIDVKAEKIDDSILKTFEIILASF